MAFLTRALITKTGDSPSACHKLARKHYALLVALDKDFPGHMDELSTRLDLLERNQSTAWYAAQIGHTVLVVRHELEQADAAAAFPRALQPARDPMSIRQGVFDFMQARQPA